MRYSEELNQVDEAFTSDGTKVIRYQETFKGIPVYGAYATIEIDKYTEEYTGQASGFLLEDVEDNISGSGQLMQISETKALDIAVKNATINSKDAVADHEKIRLFIYEQDQKAILVYDVSFRIRNRGNISRPGYIISSQTGDILKITPRLKTYRLKSIGGNSKTGKYIFGNSMPYLDVQNNNGICTLQSSDIRVFHLKNKLDIPDYPYTFKCSEGIHDAVNTAYSPMSDVFYFGNRVVSMFKDWIYLPPMKKMPIDFMVHYSENEKAYFDPYSGVIQIGDGDLIHSYPFASVDVVAHEIAHAFTEDHAALEYSGQSGGIDESMSDIVGEAAERYVYGNNDYLLGDTVYIHTGARSLCNPEQDGHSIDHVTKYIDGMDPHYCSGILNKVACHLTTHSEMSWKDVFRIFTFANRFYWHSTISFNDAGCGVLKAAYDLAYKLVPLQDALDQVGIVPCDMTNHIRMLHGHMSISGLDATTDQSEIIFRINFSKFDGNFRTMKIQTSGSSGDADILVGSTLPVTRSNSIYSSRKKGSSEVLYVKKKRIAEGYLVLLPKHSTFSGVQMTINVY